MSTRTLPVWIQGVLWLAALVILGVVFAAYTKADFLVALADTVWSCF